ncbi:MAG: hypothetical protein A3F89_04875 [Deltaproteobacteria bacterium RIFCSPLOWO2_12_FULL_50_11]|nr:MAG: hypothetical protein A3F89_04875 [Deltaproteobacteria bacterium RIFCSPLOWO2_12_FULL_50_11]
MSFPDTVGHQYKIIRHLGQGATGTVYLAHDENVEIRTVKILKNWRPDLPHEYALSHFRQHFRLLKELYHPGLAQLYDFGFDDDNQCYYIISEYIEARDLFTATIGWTPWIIEELIVQALRVLDYLHSRGLFHLNLKPTNLLVTPLRHLKVIDLDLMRQSLPQQPLGDPAYRAPELIYGFPPDGRSDLYAMGILFYHCLARKNPFLGNTIQETLTRQTSLTPTTINQIKPGIPSYLNRILVGLLEKNSSERYAKASQVIRDINQFSGHNYPVETPETPFHDLPDEGMFIGHEEEKNRTQAFCRQLLNPSPEDLPQTLWIQGAEGLGKTSFIRELQYFCSSMGLEGISIHPSREIPMTTHPEIFFLDDVQSWSYNDEERWTQYLHKKGPSSFLCVMASPPEKTPPLPRAHSLMNLSDLKILTLKPLHLEQIGHSITSLTKIASPPRAWLELLHELTGGSPLLLREWLKLFLKQGLLLDEEGAWRLLTTDEIKEAMKAASLPTNTETLILKKKAESPPGAQQLLSILCLIDTPLSLGHLEFILDQKSLCQESLNLLHQGWLSWEAKNQVLSFKSSVFKKILKKSLPHDEKTGLHDRLAEKLTQLGFGPEKVMAQRAFGKDPSKANEALLGYAHRLLEQGRIEEAIQKLEILLTRMEATTSPEKTLEVHILLIKAFMQSYHIQRAHILIPKILFLAQVLYEENEDHLEILEVLHRVGQWCIRLHLPELIRNAYELGYEILKKSKSTDPVLDLLIRNGLAQASLHEGQLKKAKATFQKTHAAWQGLSTTEQAKITNNFLGQVYLALGEIDQASTFLKDHLEFVKNLNDKEIQAQYFCDLAKTCLASKDLEAAEKYFSESSFLAQECHHFSLLVSSSLGLSRTLLERQKSKEAQKILQQALIYSQKLDEPSLTASIYYDLAQQLIKTPEKKKAETYLWQAVRTIKGLQKQSSEDIKILAQSYLALKILEPSDKTEGPEKVIAPLPLQPPPQGDDLLTKGSTLSWQTLHSLLTPLHQENDWNQLRHLILQQTYHLISADITALLIKNDLGEAELSASHPFPLPPTSRHQITERVQKFFETAKGPSHEESKEKYLILPLWENDQTTGSLYWETASEGPPWKNTTVLTILKSFAEQVSYAMTRVHRFHTIHETQQKLQTQLDQTQGQLLLARSLLEEESLSAQNRYASKTLTSHSATMKKLIKILKKIAPSPLPVLIVGEKGTEKETLAHIFHFNSPRKDKPFLSLNCSTLPEALMAQELFGGPAKQGLLAAAHQGTLFLEDIDHLSPDLQVKLAHFLHTKEFISHDNTPLKTDTRILVTSETDLKTKRRSGKLREELYAILNPIEITLPPLRERREDIPDLVETFLKEYQQETNSPHPYTLDKKVLKRIVNYDWPGNLGELENFIRVACALAEDYRITVNPLPEHSPLSPRATTRSQSIHRKTSPEESILIDKHNTYDPSKTWEDYEKIFMTEAYRHHHFRALPTARDLGVSPPTLYRKIKMWRLNDPHNPLYEETFHYLPEINLKEFRSQLFRAALQYHKRPYKALRALGVSQGFFYKILKSLKSE